MVVRNERLSPQNEVRDLRLDPNQEVYNNREAAQFLRVSRITLYRERKKGNIDFRRVGPGKVVFTRCDLETYLERQKRAAYAQD
jgi:excisionase family DNA binding protein